MLNQKQTLRLFSAAGVINLRQGVANVAGASALAMTLPSPTQIDNGSLLVITSGSAHEHVITLADGYNGGSNNTATLGGAVGDGLVLVAVNGVWRIIASTNATLSEV